MPSYKILKIEDKINLESFFTEKWIEEVTPLRGDLELMDEKIKALKNTIKAPLFERNNDLAKNAYTIKYQYNMVLPDKNKVWISDNLYIIMVQPFIFVSKGAGNLRFLVEKYVGKNYNVVPLIFPSKKMLALWKKIKKNFSKKGHEVHLHRIILENSYFEADLINQLNLSTKNLEEIGIFNDLVKNSQRIKVITFKIKWNLLDSDGNTYKQTTTRLDSSGNIMIYGNHPSIIIDSLLETLVSTFNE